MTVTAKEFDSVAEVVDALGRRVDSHRRQDCQRWSIVLDLVGDAGSRRISGHQLKVCHFTVRDKRGKLLAVLNVELG